MKYNNLGSSGILVSELGFGTWGIGGATEGASSYGPTNDSDSKRALEKAFDEGINFFDTATAYGKSEELLGQVFSGSKRDKVIIATKVGIAQHFAPQDFSREAIVKSLENSLKRLNTSYVDLLQLYNPPLNDFLIGDALEVLIELKNKGLIRAIGASLKSPAEGLIALKFKDIISLQINLNMVDQRAINNGLLESARQQNVGIIARTPLCFGFLTGKIKSLDFDSTDHRSQWPLKQLEMWLKASQLFSEVLPSPEWSLTQLALRFCMDSTGSTTTIAGPITIGEVLDNTAATKIPSLEIKTIEKIRKIYQENNEFLAEK